MTHGIHHITAISSSAQRTYDFYTKILGLRFIKKTVNFDAPDVYHLYFGNEKGEPGTVLTFFPFPDAGTGMRGLGQVTKIYFEVPLAALSFWLERFIVKNVKHKLIKKRFNESYITFYDPDGLQLEIVGTKEETTIQPWIKGGILKEHAIRGFLGAELSVESEESMETILKILNYKKIDEEEFLIRYKNSKAKSAKYLDLFLMKGWVEAITSAGTNHHIAFRVKTEKEQKKIREEILEKGFKATEVIDRNYFKSVYFREKNNILFEIATDGPGFTIDEELNDLGKNLQIPKQYQWQKKYIESVLSELVTDEDSNESKTTAEDLTLFQHRFVNNNSGKTFVLFHGTGGDEIEMIKLARVLGIKDNILSIRGNMSEFGSNRYFERYTDGSFNTENLNSELKKLDKFLKAAELEYKFDNKAIKLLGYSNGANFLLAYALTYKTKIEEIYALHPVAPIDEVKSDLSKTKVTVTYGLEDEYSTDEQMKLLEKLLKKAKAKYSLLDFEGGHMISLEEIQALQKQFAK